MDQHFKNLLALSNQEVLKVLGLHVEESDPLEYWEKKDLEYWEGSEGSDPNANMNVSSPNRRAREISDSLQKVGELSKLYKSMGDYAHRDRAINRVLSGEFYVHDLADLSTIYCLAISLTPMVFNGYGINNLNLIPKTSEEFIHLTTEVTLSLSNYTMGAIALSDFFLYYAYFDEAEADSSIRWRRRESQWKRIILSFNNDNRTAGQSPFINFSLFSEFQLKDLFKDYTYPDGSKPNFDKIQLLQREFSLWFAKEGDLPLRFPIVTWNLREQDRSDIEFVSRVNCIKGNFNIYPGKGNKIAMCCRFSNSMDDMGIDSFGNGGINIGSSRVIAINLPRLSLNLRDQDMKAVMSDIVELHLAQRRMMEEAIDKGYIKFFKPMGWMTTRNLFATIGITGVPEYSYAATGDSYNEECIERILKSIHDNLPSEGDVVFNIEEIPGEGACVKMAKANRLSFLEMYTELSDKDLDKLFPSVLSNQFVPLTEDVTIWERLKKSVYLSSLSGGGITHLNVGDISPERMERIIRFSIEYGIPHFAINFGFSECEDCHITKDGMIKVCEKCGKKIIERYDRIIGYFVPVSSWNKARKEEYPFRTRG